MGSFEEMFQSHQPKRDKYLARLFGLFAERIVHTWCACPQARYEDLGRPTLYPPGSARGSTVDFTLRDRTNGNIYVAELKSELEYYGYRYLRLTNPSQLTHHTSPAFIRFLEVARNSQALTVRCSGNPIQANGAILVWGATSAEGHNLVMADFGFADVLSLEEMTVDLGDWSPEQWVTLMAEYRTWSNQLFDFLAGVAPTYLDQGGSIHDE
jgi:hypothetical protein